MMSVRRTGGANRPQGPLLIVSSCALVAMLLLLAYLTRFAYTGTLFGFNDDLATASCGGYHHGPAVTSSFFKDRKELYASMQADFESQGPRFLQQDGETSQSLKLIDIFTFVDGGVKPVHKVVDPPIRATVLHMDPEFSRVMGTVVSSVVGPHFDKAAVWYQDTGMYHISMYHASHHLTPVPAESDEIKQEAAAVRAVVSRSCPMQLSLDRVVLTSTGVLLGCWQLLDGAEPAVMRDALKAALPRSPAKQMYNRVMLHTSFARILRPPLLPSGVTAGDPATAIPILSGIVRELNKKLCKAQTVVRQLWFVEEPHLMALALQGTFYPQKFNLTCGTL
eukprot:TRINITY_DN21256_c0_g1_i1.p1 TRINITY_DN21256_c0_g1~~TRINITY_DN21256_c0_g1_i1.p1  ORF type:complete len:336 (-),score=37.61 TRINITY_DN21256_c0_g1_i1:844-1851(-)